MEDSSQTKRYHRLSRALSVAGFLLDVAILLVVLISGWTLTLRAYAESWSDHPAVALLIYLALFGLITRTLGLPLDFLKGFWLEHRYGLSNETLWHWGKDQVKSFLVGGALAVLGLEFVYWSMRRWPAHWWVVASVGFIAFFVLLANLAPILIFPLFFKFKPLENQALTQRLLELSRQARTTVKGVFEWKLSEKSKKANAALVGLGNTRRIVLSDTLLEKFAEDEVEAVLAHEFGHHVHRHLLQGLVVQTVVTVLGFYALNAALSRLSDNFGFAGLADFANFPLLVLVSAFLSLVLLPAVNAHSRHLERQADAYALEVIADGSQFVSSLDKLAELNLAERRPPPWIELVFHGHPSIEKRIAFAQRILAAPTAGASA